MTEKLAASSSTSALESPVTASAPATDEDAKPTLWTSSMAVTALVCSVSNLFVS